MLNQGTLWTTIIIAQTRDSCPISARKTIVGVPTVFAHMIIVPKTKILTRIVPMRGGTLGTTTIRPGVHRFNRIPVWISFGRVPANFRISSRAPIGVLKTIIVRRIV